MTRVLIACERSGVVRRAFRSVGHEAYSCDIVPADDGETVFHLQCDVREVLEDHWDLMICHPECTFLCSSGRHWNGRVPGRKEKTENALDFVRILS